MTGKVRRVTVAIACLIWLRALEREISEADARIDTEVCYAAFGKCDCRHWRIVDELLVPLAGIEPALLAELDFESSASTNSATGASGRCQGQGSRSGRNIAVAGGGSTGGLAELGVTHTSL